MTISASAAGTPTAEPPCREAILGTRNDGTTGPVQRPGRPALPDQVRAAARWLRGRALSDDDQHARLPLDAVIYDICGWETWAAYDDLVARDVPLVVVEGPAWPGVTHIDIDHRGGSVALAAHLHDLGHREVATITLVGSHPQREREAGLRHVFPDARVVGACDSDVGAAQSLVAGWLADPREATAIVCQSDVQAAGVVLEARRRGIRVPEDLSVAGFDGVATPWLDLQLTTVVQPLAAKGRTTAEAALARIDGERVEDVVLPVELRAGASTGPA